jgi:molybdopterin synthase catalytic subunit
MTTSRDPRALVKITESMLDEEELARFVQTRASGAVAVFSGVVRDHQAGREVLSIEYTTVRPLADTKLHAICEEVLADTAIHRVAAGHRVGHLEVGETSVVVAASAAHRDDAFRAARKLIDRIKEVLPIWKREHFADGTAEWAEGFAVGAVSLGVASPAEKR